MTESTTGALAQVTALDEERRRYEGWIAQVEARRGAAPDHVLQRVRGDYEARLREVVGRLGEHAELLRATVADRAQELAALRDAERQLEDQRAEAELRAAVGEYTPEQWQELSSRGDAELAEVAGRRATAEAELERLEQVLELALRGARPERPSPAATPAVPEPPPADVRKPPPPARDGAGEEPWASTAAPDPWAVQPTAATAPPAPSAPDERWSASEPAVAPPSDRVEGDGPQAKTLRCQECGTMNYPTEWYCERCGGELAAL